MLRLPVCLIFALCAVVALPDCAPAQPITSLPDTRGQPPEIERLLRLLREADVVCRGSTSPDSELIYRACGRRDAWFIMLNESGWCWGLANQANFERRWHPCSDGSIGTDTRRRASMSAASYAEVIRVRQSAAQRSCEASRAEALERWEACGASEVWSAELQALAQGAARQQVTSGPASGALTTNDERPGGTSPSRNRYLTLIGLGDCGGRMSQVAQVICGNSTLMDLDAAATLPYYVLRYAQPDRQPALRNEAIAANARVATSCNLSTTQNAPPMPDDLRQRAVPCAIPLLQAQRDKWLDDVRRLSLPAAYEEARRGGSARQLQAALVSTGYLPADTVIDGIIGPAMRQAILAFQRQRGIAADGYVSDELRTHMPVIALMYREDERSAARAAGSSRPAPQASQARPAAPSPSAQPRGSYAPATQPTASVRDRANRAAQAAGVQWDLERRQNPVANTTEWIARSNQGSGSVTAEVNATCNPRNRQVMLRVALFSIGRQGVDLSNSATELARIITSTNHPLWQFAQDGIDVPSRYDDRQQNRIWTQDFRNSATTAVGANDNQDMAAWLVRVARNPFLMMSPPGSSTSPVQNPIEWVSEFRVGGNPIYVFIHPNSDGLREVFAACGLAE